MTAGVAVFAASVALKGLTTWRRQLRGNSQYDLARRLVLSAYKLRNAIEGVRSPGIHSMESAHALKETGISLEGKNERDSLRAQKGAVYQLRWRQVQDVKSELHVNCLEAQVLWGEVAKSAYQQVNGCIQKLWAAIVVDLEFEAEGVREDPAAMIARKNVLWPMAKTPEEDQFLVELNRAIQRLEELAKPHLALS